MRMCYLNWNKWTMVTKLSTVRCFYRTRSVQTSRELGGRIDAARSGRYGGTEVATEPQVEIKRMECGKSCISRWPGGRVAVAVAHASLQWVSGERVASGVSIASVNKSHPKPPPL